MLAGNNTTVCGLAKGLFCLCVAFHFCFVVIVQTSVNGPVDHWTGGTVGKKFQVNGLTRCAVDNKKGCYLKSQNNGSNMLLQKCLKIVVLCTA